MLRDAAGAQEYVPAPPLAVKVALCPVHIELAGLWETGSAGGGVTVSVTGTITGSPGQVFISVYETE